MYHATITAMKDGSLAVNFSYDPGLIGALKAAIPYVDRKWDPGQKVWHIAPQHGQTMAKLIEQYLDETVRVPQVTQAVAHSTQLFQVMYIGAAKERGNGESSSYGYADGTWRVIFPLDVLQQWFCVTTRPDERLSLYAILGIPQTATQSGLKAAFRRLARQWHPDVCKEPDATQQFQAINHAYEVLSSPLQRQKYDAGLAFEASLTSQQAKRQTLGSLLGSQPVWKPPLRCGWILVEGIESLGRFVVDKILQWEDVVNEQGRTLVTSWPSGADTFVEGWV